MEQRGTYTKTSGDHTLRIVLTGLFAIAMAYIEAAVVVYLRELYYPDGFTLPLVEISPDMIGIEIIREAATLVMLVIVAALAGRKLWERFAFFLVLFGTWDIFYYVWLKVALGWPSSLLDWDVLFLIPVPWIGPVIAPVLVALCMIVIGLLIVRLFALGYDFHPTPVAWILALIGSAVILYSFMYDTAATLRPGLPKPYPYWLLLIGLAMYTAAWLHAYRASTRAGDPA